MARRRSYRRTPYRYTARRAAALKKAQAISARKRRNRRIAVGAVAVGAAATGLAVRHKVSGSSFSVNTHGPVSKVTKQVTGSRKASLSNSALGGGARKISFHTKKQGPLGSSKVYSYNHQPVFKRRVKPVRKGNSAAVEFVEPTMTYGGVPITTGRQVYAQGSISFNTRRIDKPPRYTKLGGSYIPNRRKQSPNKSTKMGKLTSTVSKENVHGQTIDSYMRDFDKRHGFKRR